MGLLDTRVLLEVRIFFFGRLDELERVKLEVYIFVGHVAQGAEINFQLIDVYLFLSGVFSDDNRCLYLLLLPYSSSFLVIFLGNVRSTALIPLLSFLDLIPQFLQPFLIFIGCWFPYSVYLLFGGDVVEFLCLTHVAMVFGLEQR